MLREDIKWWILNTVRHILFGFERKDKITVVSGKYRGKNGSIKKYDWKHGGYRVSLNSIGSKGFLGCQLRRRVARQTERVIFKAGGLKKC